MRPIQHSILIFVLALAGAMSASAAQGSVDSPIRILFIGNSYTFCNDMPVLIEGLAAAVVGARRVETETIAFGGASLKDHWNRGQAQAAIAGRRWDYVVLQERSGLPLRDLGRARQYIQLFDGKIRAAGAKTILYVTWARAFAPASQASLNKAYDGISRDTRVALAPVGTAWLMARRARPGIQLYEADDSRPTLAGSYLAAYVLHVVLFGKMPDRAAVPEGLTVAEHKVLLDAAAKASLSTMMSWRTTMSDVMPAEPLQGARVNGIKPKDSRNFHQAMSLWSN